MSYESCFSLREGEIVVCGTQTTAKVGKYFSSEL